jgi:hypothetical protein
MGPEIALALLAGGTGAQMLGQREQRRDRARILNASMDEADRTQGRAIADVTAEAQRMAPDQRMADMAAAEQQVFDRSQADLGGAVDIAPSQGAGAVSQAFETMRGQRGAQETARMGRIARMLAANRAPGEVETAGGLRRGAMSESLASMWRSQNNRSNAARMDAEAVDMPVYGQLGQLASMAGSAGLMAGGLPNSISPAPVTAAKIRWLPGGG